MSQLPGSHRYVGARPLYEKAPDGYAMRADSGKSGPNSDFHLYGGTQCAMKNGQLAQRWAPLSHAMCGNARTA